MSYIYDYLAAIDEDQQLIVHLECSLVKLRWNDVTVELKRTPATRYLVELLLHPYQGISAAALYALVNSPGPCPTNAARLGLDITSVGDSFHTLLPTPLADPRAIREVRLRLNLLAVQIDEAALWNDLGRLEELKLERDTLADYLQETLNRTGFSRMSSDQDYKCSDNIYQALHHLLQTIVAASPELGSLLKDSLQIWHELLFVPAKPFSVLVVDART